MIVQPLGEGVRYTHPILGNNYIWPVTGLDSSDYPIIPFTTTAYHLTSIYTFLMNHRLNYDRWWVAECTEQGRGTGRHKAGLILILQLGLWTG